MNRNRIKNWSITFPQTDVERKAFADTFPPYEEAICCREEHDDGGFHLHLGIRLTKGITKTRLLKWIMKKYPDDYKRIDVQPTRSIRQWIDYISKEDPDIYEHVNMQAVEARRAYYDELIRQNGLPVTIEEWCEGVKTLCDLKRKI